jgi:hypothetical protein
MNLSISVMFLIMKSRINEHDSYICFGCIVPLILQFELPNPAGRAGGACTSALLQVLYRHKHAAAPMSWVECLRKMRTELQQMGYDQIPQLTSSRLIDVNKPMLICPPNSHGRKRALLIGINYTGQQGQLVSFISRSFAFLFALISLMNHCYIYDFASPVVIMMYAI